METQFLQVAILAMTLLITSLIFIFKVKDLKNQLKRKETFVGDLIDKKEYYRKEKAIADEEVTKVKGELKATDTTVLNLNEEIKDLRKENQTLREISAESLAILKTIIYRGNQHLVILDRTEVGHSTPALRLSYNEEIKAYEMKIYKNNESIGIHYDYIIDDWSVKNKLNSLKETFNNIDVRPESDMDIKYEN